MPAGAAGRLHIVTRRLYGPALRVTLRQTAAAYGYTLTIATTSAILASVHGKPRSGDVFLFAAGGLLAFAVLDAIVALTGTPEEDSPATAFPFAGALNFVSVGAALGASVALTHAVGSAIAWLLTPLAATSIYLLVVGAQVAVVARAREGSK